MVRCEDLVQLIRGSKSLDQISKERDAYDLSFRLLRKYEYILRKGYDPSKDRDIFIKGIISEIASKFSSKRIQFSLPDAEEISSKILDILKSMDKDFRSLCGLYFQLKKLRRKEIDQMIDLVKGIG
jgi:hypothetical protein